jgi:hypothetical protein
LAASSSRGEAVFRLFTLAASMSYLLDHPYQLFVVLAVILPIAAEMGMRWPKQNTDEKQEAGLSTIYGGILGLLGLLLGFTFAMALSRFEVRRQLVVDEANAIGTTWLRADMLPEPYRDAEKYQMYEYVGARLDFYSAGLDTIQVEKALRRATQMQDSLWRQAVEAAQKQPTPITGLFIQSLNEMIDLESSRQDALENRIPSSVWTVLLTVSAAASAMTGALYPRRTSIAFLLVPLVLASVMALIADLDSSRRGLIRISQGSMVRLETTMKKSLPATPPP